MLNRYVVFGSERGPEGEAPGPEMELLPIAEFEQLETAIDFAEFYRRKNPDAAFEIRGLSYNRSSVHKGEVLFSWEPIPQHLRRMAAEEFISWLEPE